MHQRIPQLDAVRGIAILVVMLHNSGTFPRLFAQGWMGVDLFFVLSGFLITGILLDTKQSESYFKNFYVRRCLRIWPLYYSALFFMFVLVPFLRPSEASTVFAARSSPWWAYPLFLQNFLVPTPTAATGLLGVTWSLAVEEQFYLVWPWVIRFCSSTQVRRLAMVVICVSPALRFYLSLHHVDIYSNPFCRLDALMAGALLAIVVRSENFYPATLLKRAWLVFFVAAPTGTNNGDLRCQMDRVFFHGDGLGLICISGAVLLAKMAPSLAEEPVPDIYGSHQLWSLPASQDSA